ncbi:MAG: M3 family metallopeptidase [Arenicellales bacterium]|nr:M3 family metallopeptidase [Arenicellales bacterium]
MVRSVARLRVPAIAERTCSLTTRHCAKLDAKNYRSGSAMLRQIYFGHLDMELHHYFDPSGEESVADVKERVAKTSTVVAPLAEDRFLCAFGHIFSGSYSAGYYSYKWAEVLSADAFSLFEQNGIFDRKSGHAFLRHILEAGGSDDPMKLFVAFRGREPRIEPLLRHAGLEPSETVGHSCQVS